MSYISELIEENSSLIRNGLIMIIGILLIILLLVLIRHFKTPGKQQKIIRKKKDTHLDRIEKLRFLDKEPREKLLLLDNIIIEYLAGIFKINKKEGYEKISKKLRERGYSDLADFCNEVEYHMYGNAEVKEKDITYLINKFESLVNFRIMSLMNSKRQIIQKNIRDRKEIERLERIKKTENMRKAKKTETKKNSNKLSTNMIRGFFRKSFVNEKDYNKNEEIQKLRKLWYPEEK